MPGGKQPNIRPKTRSLQRAIEGEMYTLNKCAYGPRRKNAQLLGQIGDLPSSDSVAKAQDICDRKRGCAGFTKGTVNFMARTGDGPSGGLELPGDWQPQPSGGPSTLLPSSDSSQFPSTCSSLPLVFGCSNVAC